MYILNREHANFYIQKALHLTRTCYVYKQNRANEHASVKWAS